MRVQNGDGVEILGAFIGKIAPYGLYDEPSAYLKLPQPGQVNVDRLGIEGDEQGDPTVHGGPDKALHHYPFDHYAAFAAERPEFAGRLEKPGFFAENISTAGWTEHDVCIGDRFRLGTALVELSEGRSPCWKLGHRFRDQSMVQAVLETRRAGWYYRVLEPGSFRRGDRLVLTGRPNPDWTVARVFGHLLAGDIDRDAYATLSELPELGGAWRNRAVRLHQMTLRRAL